MSGLTQEGTSRFVEVDGVRIHYHEAGEGPTAILLHGGGPGASGWSNFHGNIDAFSKNFRTVIVDMPGFGESDKPISEEKLGAFNARYLVPMMDKLGIDKAHFVGNSMGGHVALKIAIDQPDRVDRMVLMAPALLVAFIAPNPTEGAKILRTYYHAPGPSRERMRQFLSTLVYDQSHLDEDIVEKRYQRSIEPDIQEWSKHMAPRPDRFEPLWPELSRIQHRSLLVWGRDDRVVPLDRALYMLHQMPNVRLHVIGKCGHWVMVEHPESFNRLCTDFLTES